jgi:4-diphosphocytidyl-2-C-methyl-D-erythritol kinase
MSHARAFAKINLGLVVGPLRGDGKHEIVTILQRVDLHDDLAIEPAGELAIDGFPDDTIVRAALVSLARAAELEPCWSVRIEKRIPVAAGLGGGSADAAAALRLANALLPRPLSDDVLHQVAASVGADVPFFLRDGAQVATGSGTELTPVALPTDYHIVLLVPRAETKQATAAVYESFDARQGARGFDRRVTEFRDALATIATARDLATLPPSDLAVSRFAAALRDAGAFRADVSGAGPTVYGLFERHNDARRAADLYEDIGSTFLTRPV